MLPAKEYTPEAVHHEAPAGGYYQDYYLRDGAHEAGGRR